MTESIRITSRGVVNGKMQLSDTAREKLFKFLKMDEGNWLLTRTKDKSYKSSRYKYYWAGLLLQAVTKMNLRGLYQIHNEETGEVSPLTCEDLHGLFKQYYNPVIVRYENMKIIKGGSTKKLSDSEFIGEYLEKIYVFLSELSIEVMPYSDWTERMKEGATSEELAKE